MKNWEKLLKDNFFLILLTGVILSFFYPSILRRKIPIPADTIVGMYHPFRDKIWDGFTAGVPYKNFLITDPVRQQYVWRKLAIDEMKKGNLPVWNPYAFAGTPLLANFQSASFYPLNILFFIFPFNLAWTILVILQPLLAGIFLYLYLRYMKVSTFGSFLGGFTFAFSGFSIAWLEWNTVLATALWLPLILLSIEKIVQCLSVRMTNGKIIIWSLIFIFSLVSSFFAGHLQIFFYSFLITIIYTTVKIITLPKRKVKTSLFFILCSLFFAVITSIQWIPTIQFIVHSARGIDQGSWMKEGWFIPWQNLVQFLIPDFFGNPATGNYWGVWNYGEFIGYIGVAPLILAVYALIFRKDKKTLFFGGFAILSLVFALPTPLAKLPYQFALPLISTSQPTRLLFITDFSLSILAALGFDLLLWNLKDRHSIKKLIGIALIFLFIFFIAWLIVLNPSWTVSAENILIAKRNLVLPTLIIILITAVIVGFSILKKQYRFTQLLYSIVVIVSVFELFRFGWKFTPFTPSEWIFPQTNILSKIQSENDYSRIMAVDRRIMPPNFAASYKFHDVAGYDPLYLKDYSELVASWERNSPDLSPSSFNRIITPQNYDSFITDLFGVRYILSLTPLESSKLDLIGKEGDTYLYRNTKVFPRTYLAQRIVKAQNQKDMINTMFKLKDNLKTAAVTTENIEIDQKPLESGEEVEITNYLPSHVIIESNTIADRLLVLSDIYYPGWQVFVDGKISKIYKVNFALRGVLVPAGRHKIEFKANLL